MAVWGSFAFDNRLVAPDTRADWAWAMAQWDLVAQAGHAVRVVVVDQRYSTFDTTVPNGESQRADARARFAACRARDQLVFGQVYAAGGKLPLGSLAEKFTDPLRPDRQVFGMAAQIDAWRNRYGDQIDGIYVDSGPTDCTDPTVTGSDQRIPQNYRAYVSALRQHGYKVFLQAAQYPDDQGWVQGLGADLLQLWEGGGASYATKYGATDACRPGQPPQLPGWWADPGADLRWSRVHVVDDCRDADTMQKLVSRAIGRGAGTIWITRPRQDSSLGAVFDVLPPYWDDEVGVFRAFADSDEQKEAKDNKEDKDGKDDKDEPDNEKNQKDTKDQQDKSVKEDKDQKDSKDDPDQAAKSQKDDKDDKDVPDKGKEDPKDNKNEQMEEKWNKDDKDSKDEKDHEKVPDIVKDSEAMAKSIEATGAPTLEPSAVEPDDHPESDEPRGRTFIRPDERPAVGERTVADPDHGPR